MLTCFLCRSLARRKQSVVILVAIVFSTSNFFFSVLKCKSAMVAIAVGWSRTGSSRSILRVVLVLVTMSLSA